jgi:hypothetical protein
MSQAVSAGARAPLARADEWSPFPPETAQQNDQSTKGPINLDFTDLTIKSLAKLTFQI